MTEKVIVPADLAVFLNGPGTALAKKTIPNDCEKWDKERDVVVLERFKAIADQWEEFFRRRADEPKRDSGGD